MTKANRAAKEPKSGSAEIVDFKRPTRPAGKPLVFEFVSPANVDQVCEAIGENVTLWTNAKQTEFSNAFMWMAARAGQAFVMVAHDGDKIWAASFWKLENWANGIVLRCVAAAGVSDDPAEWVGPFIELARARAKTAGAERIIFETYDDQSAAALPEDAQVLRQSYILGV